jgi:hypothetical protein
MFPGPGEDGGEIAIVVANLLRGDVLILELELYGEIARRLWSGGCS